MVPRMAWLLRTGFQTGSVLANDDFEGRIGKVSAALPSLKDFVCPCLNPRPAIDKGFLQVMGFRCSVNLRDWEKARLSHLVEVNKPPLGLYPRLLTALHVLPRCKGIHYSKGKNVSARSHAGQKHLWVRWGAP